MTKPSKAKMIIGIVIGALGVLIAFQNLEPVNTMVLLWRFTMPYALLFVIILGADFVLGVTVAVMLGARYLSE